MINHCRVGTCPALKVEKSTFGYCSIHDMVATQPEMYDKALAGKLTPLLKVFAEDIRRGVYPKRIW